MPNSKQAGLVSIGDLGVVAFDLVAAEFRDDKIIVLPASKSAIEDDKIRDDEQGLILATREDGRVNIAGMAVNYRLYMTFVDRMQELHRVVATIGASAICLGRNLDWPQLETLDVNSQSGEVTLAPYAHFL